MPSPVVDFRRWAAGARGPASRPSDLRLWAATRRAGNQETSTLLVRLGGDQGWALNFHEETWMGRR